MDKQQLSGFLHKVSRACSGNPRYDVETYHEHLGEYPTDVVAEACTQWVAASVWFPSVAELMQMCNSIEQSRLAPKPKPDHSHTPARPPLTPSARRILGWMSDGMTVGEAFRRREAELRGGRESLTDNQQKASGE